MRTWGLNTAYGPALNDALPASLPARLPYVYPLRGWQMIEGAIMGLPDVYSDEFARRVDADAARQLAPRKDDPWMIGYFIGNEPPWPGRESQLVDLVLAVASPEDGGAPAKARDVALLTRAPVPGRKVDADE